MAVTRSTRCLVDFLQLPSGLQICGQNSGEHGALLTFLYFYDRCINYFFLIVYVDLERDNCIDFSVFVGRSGQADSTVERKWSIKFSQYSCNFNNLAPVGCTQYFFGSLTNVVRSFNFDGKLHLANQNQNICVRYLL